MENTIVEVALLRRLQKDRADLLEALKDASNMLLSGLDSDPREAYETEQFIKHIDSVIKKAEGG